MAAIPKKILDLVMAHPTAHGGIPVWPHPNRLDIPQADMDKWVEEGWISKSPPFAWARDGNTEIFLDYDEESDTYWDDYGTQTHSDHVCYHYSTTVQAHSGQPVQLARLAGKLASIYTDMLEAAITAQGGVYDLGEAFEIAMRTIKDARDSAIAAREESLES